MSRLRSLGALVWILAILGLASGLYAASRTEHPLPFRLREVRVVGASRTDPGAVWRAAGVEPGSPLFGIDVGRVREAVEALPWVRRARVVRQIPSTLRIRVEEWVPRYLIRLDRLCYLTAEGHVVRAPLDQGLDFPVVTGITAAELTRDGPVRRALLDLLARIDRGELPGEVGEIHVDPTDGLTVYTASPGARAVRLGFRDLGDQLRRLARLDRHLAKRGQRARVVDLDYEDKIVARLEGAGGRSTRP